MVERALRVGIRGVQPLVDFDGAEVLSLFWSWTWTTCLSRFFQYRPPGFFRLPSRNCLPCCHSRRFPWIRFLCLKLFLFFLSFHRSFERSRLRPSLSPFTASL